MSNQYQQPQQPRKRGGFLKAAGLGCLGLIAFVFVIGVIAAIALEDDTSTATTEPGGSTKVEGEGKPAGEEQSEKPAGIGDSVRDGKFEFTVTKIETGVKSIGSDFWNEKPQGQFVLIDVTVENIGDEAQYLAASDQYLFDQNGRRHSADDDAWIVLEDNPLLEQINPGNTVKGTIVFDIPKNATPVTLELHDSAFSGGVTVDVRGSGS